jgi:N4-gp56 family major capsid protein
LAKNTFSAEGLGLQPLPELILRIYSKDLEFAAQPNMRFDQFAVVKTDLRATPGDGITFFKYNNLPRGGSLVENVPMTTHAMTGAQVTILVTEYGNAVAVTNKLLKTSFANIMSDAAVQLGHDYAVVMDELGRDTVETVPNVILAGSNVAVDDLDGTDILTLAEIKDSVEILSTNLSMKIGNDHWICFVSPHQSRNLRDDPDWIGVAKLDPPRLYKGEIGRVDDVIFIETTQVSIEENVGGTDIHTAIIMGQNVFGKAVADPVHMVDNGVIDFGRERQIGWYGIFGEGVINEDNAVQIKTA